MEQKIARQLADELKIDVTQIVREYWELLFLNGLFEGDIGRNIILKGSTALRLGYGSPRFSEHLDFNLRSDRLSRSFEEVAEKLVKPYREAEITDLARKRWTYLCEIRVSQGYLPQPFRIKIEISRRFSTEYDFGLRLITSPTTPIQVLANVATIEQLYKDKMDCLAGRAAPKDLFDLWFISQKLKNPYKPPKTSFSRKEITRDLGKYLPLKYRKVIKELL